MGNTSITSLRTYETHWNPSETIVRETLVKPFGRFMEVPSPWRRSSRILDAQLLDTPLSSALAFHLSYVAWKSLPPQKKWIKPIMKPKPLDILSVKVKVMFDQQIV